jgi:sugar lactone lactonase YvrE
MLALAGGALVLAGVGAAMLLLRGREEPKPAPVAAVAPVVVPAPAPAPPAPPPPPPAPKPWTAERSFGELGTGPGMFTSPRALAVTDDGQVFVAEADTGRVHQFDASGAFVRLIELTGDKLTKQKRVFGMAADHAGHVWVVRSGDLLQLRAADGAVAKTIAGDYPDTYFHGSVAVDAKNHVYATTDRTGDHDLVEFDPAGKRVHRHKNLDSEAVAVDGVGTLYVARSGQVDVLGADGAVKGRFSASASGRGIRVDDRGHFYVDEGSGLGVYEPGGKRLASLDLPPFVDFVVARDGALVALHADGKVTRYRVTLPAP